MSELRVGGLAIIIQSSIEHEVGKVVTCLELISPGMPFVPPQTNAHTFQWPDNYPTAWMVSGDIQSECQWQRRMGTFLVNGWGIYTSDQLMPIDGEDFSHEGERQKELSHG